MQYGLSIGSSGSTLLPTGSLVRAVLRRKSDLYFYNVTTQQYQLAANYPNNAVVLDELPAGSLTWFGVIPDGANDVALKAEYYRQVGGTFVGPPTDVFVGGEDVFQSSQPVPPQTLPNVATTTTLTRQFRVNNVLTDMTSVVLQDPTGTFGVRRTDTQGIVVASGTPMVRQSVGTYVYTLQDPVPGLQYEYWTLVTSPQGIVTQTQRYAASTLGASLPGPNPTSPYFSYQQFVDRFGVKNITIAANKDSADQSFPSSLTPKANLRTIQFAMDLAADELNGMFYQSKFAVPLSFTTNGGLVPPVVSEWAMCISYGHLFGVRAWWVDNKSATRDSVGVNVSAMVKRVYMEISQAVGGLRPLRGLDVSSVFALTGTGPQTVMPYDIAADPNAWKSAMGFRFVDGEPRFFSVL